MSEPLAQYREGSESKPQDEQRQDDDASKKQTHERIVAGKVEDTPSSASPTAPNASDSNDAPTPPGESETAGPPLPNEPVPQAADDGWDCHWDANSQNWYFLNRFTGQSQWENPRVPSDATPAPAPSEPAPPSDEEPAAGGYNPAIHGDYDPNAWYAQSSTQGDDDEATRAAAMAAAAAAGADPSALYGQHVAFNRFTGQYQSEDQGPGRHSDEAKSKRQMNAYFDVDAAANAHDGRSLKAERSNQKLTKKELKAFKEKRRTRKEEKRRAWLKD